MYRYIPKQVGCAMHVRNVRSTRDGVLLARVTKDQRIDVVQRASLLSVCSRVSLSLRLTCTACITPFRYDTHTRARKTSWDAGEDKKGKSVFRYSMFRLRKDSTAQGKSLRKKTGTRQLRHQRKEKA